MQHGCLTVERDRELGHAVLRERVLDRRVRLPDLERPQEAIRLAGLGSRVHIAHEAARQRPLQLAAGVVHLHPWGSITRFSSWFCIGSGCMVQLMRYSLSYLAKRVMNEAM